MRARDIITSALALSLTACTTTYKDSDFNKYAKKEIAHVEKLAKAEINFNTDRNRNQLNYEQMLQVAKDYSGLSSHSLNLGISTGNEVSFSNLNLTGIRNSQYSTIRTLERVIGDGNSTSSLFLGNADSSSQQARSYQMSSQLVQGVSFITSNHSNRNFLLNIDKLDGLAKNKYTVSIVFGFPDLIAKQRVSPVGALETISLDAGVGYLVAGPIGAIGFAGHTLIEEPIAMSMGRKNPKGTRRVRGQTPITQSSQTVANTFNTLEEATRSNTDTLLAVKTEKGTGVVYLSQKPDRVVVNGDTIAFSLDKKDAFALYRILMHLSKATVALGVNDKTYNLISGSSGSGSSGSSVSGSESGGSSGK